MKNHRQNPSRDKTIAKITGINVPYVKFYYMTDMYGEDFILNPYSMDSVSLDTFSLSIGQWLKIAKNGKTHLGASSQVVEHYDVEATTEPPSLCLSL